MKLLTLLIIVAGATYVYDEMPEAPQKKAPTCKNSSRKSVCPNKEIADTKDS